MTEFDWKLGWDQPPCNSCKRRWPNKDNPDAEIGDGCDGLSCWNRPDFYDMYEPKTQNKDL